MHASTYHYYSYEELACRVMLQDGKEVRAELYRPGVGFAEAPLRQITHDGRAITKQDFDRMVLALARQSDH